MTADQSEIEDFQIVDQIIHAIKTVCGSNKIGLHEPLFIGNEWKYVKNCLDTNFVSSVGEYVNEFENNLATYTGSKYAIAVVNGTAALHISLLLAGVLPGDEVLMPALTFVATANAIKYCGAIPHFVDSDENTLGINAESLRSWLNFTTIQKNGFCINKLTGRRIKVLLPMHTFGHPCNLEDLILVANDFNLVVVEDAAESLGSFYKGTHTGTFGEIGILSFNGNKTITTGGGGAILTNDQEIAKKAKHITTTSKIAHPWLFNHDEVGYNYRMPNINAALGCAQLENLNLFIQAKRSLYLKYVNAFEKIPKIKIFSEPNNCKSNYWLQTMVLDSSIESLKEVILEKTNEFGIMTRPTWTLMNKLVSFIGSPHSPLIVAELLEKTLINIPSSPQIIIK